MYSYFCYVFLCYETADRLKSCHGLQRRVAVQSRAKVLHWKTILLYNLNFRIYRNDIFNFTISAPWYSASSPSTVRRTRCFRTQPSLSLMHEALTGGIGLAVDYLCRTPSFLVDEFPSTTTSSPRSKVSINVNHQSFLMASNPAPYRSQIPNWYAMKTTNPSPHLST